MEFYGITLLVRDFVRLLCLIVSLLGGGLKGFVRLVCLIVSLLSWVWWLRDTVKYFTRKECYTNLVRHKNIPAIFRCIRSYLCVLLHLCILICILIWAWR